MRKWSLGAFLTSAVAASAALTVPSPAVATGTVIGADAPGALPGRYIVTLKERAGGPRVRSLGAGKVLRDFRGIAGFAAEMSATQARRLAADPAVRSVEQDRRVRIATTEHAVGLGPVAAGQDSGVRLASAGQADGAGRTGGAARADGAARANGARRADGAGRADGVRAAGGARAAGGGQIGGGQAAVGGEGAFRSAGTQTSPAWGLDRIDQRSVAGSKSYTPTDDGSSVHAYVIDTGIRITHKEFGGRASYGYDFADDDRYAADCNGHGTHVAGTIGGAHYGVAKKVRLVAVRVLDCYGEGDLSDVIDGVDWVTEHAVKPAVANMSMGGAASPSLDFAVRQSIASGVTYVVAAGNEDVDASWSSPADVSAAITVAATDSRDRRATFSNYGRVVDLFAPGVNIKSSVSGSNSATAVYSGTSMAAPHVAGAAALILDAGPALTPSQVRARLVANATTGKVTDRAGAPNRLLFVPAPPAEPVIATSRTAVATVGTPYASRVNLKSGRTGTWQVAAGSMPPGLSLAHSGAITGTPTEPGEYAVTVRFTDYVPRAVTRTIVIPVVAGTPVLGAELPPVRAGVDYQGRLVTADGREGAWSLLGGALPAGLSLDGTGLISGVPTAVDGETASFTAGFTDVWGGTATRNYTLVVGPAA
ncbi:S8 family peptidase [Actinoplanes oblitus]|uniref:S8 family peptidase n=1 Tax=Actinoplanes oblitus TaxID=3040509 RepID=A0ABY8WB06_9ACTN|nr:S8 family peptidase [Actinoplanes oblitus]WIM95044.1 S8 family peptidase [Actinoplanes oblitus]